MMPYIHIFYTAGRRRNFFLGGGQNGAIYTRFLHNPSQAEKIWVSGVKMVPYIHILGFFYWGIKMVPYIHIWDFFGVKMLPYIHILFFFWSKCYHMYTFWEVFVSKCCHIYTFLEFIFCRKNEKKKKQYLPPSP